MSRRIEGQLDEYECVHPLRLGDKIMYACIAAGLLVKLILWLLG